MGETESLRGDAGASQRLPRGTQKDLNAAQSIFSVNILYKVAVEYIYFENIEPEHHGNLWLVTQAKS